MNLSEVLGRESNADIFDYGEHQVKLFHEDVDYKTIEHEFHYTKEVAKCYHHTVKLIEITEIDEHKGIVFERVSGRSILNILEESPDRLLEYASDFTEYQLSLNQLTPSNLMDQKSYFTNQIEIAPLKDDTKVYLKRLLDTLPTSNKLCHGDFHPDKVIIDHHDYIIIDFSHAYIGDPISDYAKTCVVMASPRHPEEASKFLIKQLKKSRKKFIEIYKSCYEKNVLVDQVVFKSFHKLAAVTRLNELIKEERDWLLSIIGEGVL